jgi:hypothetical protein
VTLRGIHDHIGDQYVLQWSDGLSARVPIDRANVEVLEVIVSSG